VNRNQKTINVGEREITVFELKVKQIRKLFQIGPDDNNLEGFKRHAAFFCENALFGIKFEEFDDLTPGQIDHIYETFKEVNSAFFQKARLLSDEGTLGEFWKTIRSAISKDLIALFANQYRQAIAAPESTDTGTS